MNDEQRQLDDLNRATSRRLARLGDAEVDTSRLVSRLDAALGGESARPVIVARRWRQPVFALAATVAVAVSIAVVLMTGSEPVAAAPLELTRLHRGLVNGDVATVRVDSFEQANQVIADQHSGAPHLPAYSGVAVRSCCLTNVQGVLVAAVVLEHKGHAVTLVVANGRDFSMPMGQVLERGGQRLFAHEMDGLQMVMANQGEYWLCVMGDVPVAELADLAGQVRFDRP